MKIAANPMPFSDIAPPASNAGSNTGYGRAFESTIQDIAKDSSAQVRAREDRSAARQDEADRQAPSAEPAPRAPASEKASETKAVNPKDRREEPAKDPNAKEDDAEGDAIAFLGRLLGGGIATPAAAVKAVDAEAERATDERVIIVSLDVGAEDVAAVDGAEPGARGKVKLEVVHMETHFEPRSDAFVLVDGGEANGMILGATEEGSAPLSFDQALARLSERKAGKAAATAEDAKTVATETIVAKADAAVAHEITAQERIKERSRINVSAEVGASRADQQREAVEVQTETAVTKKDATESAVDKITAKLGQAASDAADARKSAAPLAAREPTGTLPLASMTGQVAGRVIDALGATLASQRPSDLPSEAYLRMTAGGAALKTLTIQLQPETLGKLDVSMRLVDGQLTLEIAATEAATAKVLAQDRDGLRKLLQHAGFSVDDASITIVTRDASTQPQVRAAAAGDAAGAQQDSGGGSNAGANDRGDGPPSRRQGGARDEGPRQNDNGRPSRSASNYL